MMYVMITLSDKVRALKEVKVENETMKKKKKIGVKE